MAHSPRLNLGAEAFLFSRPFHFPVPARYGIRGSGPDDHPWPLLGIPVTSQDPRGWSCHTRFTSGNGRSLSTLHCQPVQVEAGGCASLVGNRRTC